MTNIPYELLEPIWEYAGLNATEVTGFDVRSDRVDIYVILRVGEQQVIDAVVECGIDRGTDD